jgi:hemolysin III
LNEAARYSFRIVPHLVTPMIDDPARPPAGARHDAGMHRRAHSRHERYVDGAVHIAGLVAGVVGAFVLVKLAASQKDAGKIAAVSVYGLGLIAMFAASAAYNLGYHTRSRALLRRLDHSAIFLMIAGTYTPLTTQIMGGIMALMSTLAIWVTASAGIGMKLATPRLFERFGVAFYLLLGWIGIIVFGPYVLGLPSAAVWTLFAGGVLYSAGVIFHVWEKLPFQNAIWHLFVLAAAACHWVSILTGVVLPS